MLLKVAETAGFCYGVRRAIAIAEKEAPGGCFVLGELIHNRMEMERLRKLGLRSAGSVEEVPAGETVLIRSHGEPEGVFHALAAKGCRVVDATCPNVSRIHRIVREAAERGRLPIVIGDRDHPEVRGIVGSAPEVVVLRDEGETEKWLRSGAYGPETPVTVVFQTTEIRERVKKCADSRKKVYTNQEKFDTICDATFSRQKEATGLSAICDAMLVVGDRSSANTRRLAEICAGRCPKVIFAETASELDLSDLKDVRTLGVTAGASTPAWIIKEVCAKMTEELKIEETAAEATAEVEAAAPVEIAEAAPVEAAPAAPAPQEGENAPESFDEMLEKSFKTLNNGDKVTGIVASIGTNEITVDLGTKHSGYIPMSELTDDPDVKPEDVVQVGQEIETFVIRVNDVEGTVQLSKKRLDTVKNWDSIEAAREERIPVEGTVTEENKGGVVVSVRGINVFVPASQSGLPKDTPMTELLGQKVRLRVTEVNQQRRRVVGSIRAVQYEERREKAEAIWNEIEVGKHYEGVVKSLTSYGAFVDIGGIDGMVHVSEISWSRIRQPSDVLSVGDKIDVYVISFDKELKKISLGHKDKSQNPWLLFTNQYKVGDIANVRIVKLMPFGAFAEIIPGVDGLIHISQLADHRVAKADDVVTVDQRVDVKIVDIDNEKQKVSLSIRALLAPAPAPKREEPEAEPVQEDDVVVYDTDKPPVEEAPAEEAPAEEAPAAE